MDGLTAPRPAPVFEFTPEPGSALLERAVRRFGNRPAIDFMGRRWSYARLGALADRAAAGLQRLGVAKGVNVGLCLPNCPYFVIMYHAILKAGGTVVNFNPLYTAHEIEAQARDAQVSVMVSLDLAMIHDKIAPLAAAGALKQVVVCGMAAALPPVKSVLFRLLKAKELARVPAGGPLYPLRTVDRRAGGARPGGDRPAGRCGGAAIHRRNHRQAEGGDAHPRQYHRQRAAGARGDAAGRPGPRADSRGAAVLPCVRHDRDHESGAGDRRRDDSAPRLELKSLMDTLHRTRPTILPGVPTLFTAISKEVEETPKTDLGFVKFCISGGAPLAAELMDRFERISRSQILEGYGLSETSPVVTFNLPGAVKRGSVGPAVPGTVIEIRDRDNPAVILPQGERGEICVRGPQVMRGYYHRPEETAQTFVEGALRTGDVGYLDKDGYLFIVDRIKDLIICGGYNVYPRVIEEAAYQHPAVQDAIAIGVPDQYRGQAPKLFVTLRAGQSATEAEILQFLAGLLNKIELPRAVEIRESLPKTMVGKLSKKELVAEEQARAKS